MNYCIRQKNPRRKETVNGKSIEREKEEEKKVKSNFFFVRHSIKHSYSNIEERDREEKKKKIVARCQKHTK